MSDSRGRNETSFKEPGRLLVLFESTIARVLTSHLYRNYVESLNLKGSERVLDFGPGAAGCSLHIARRLQEGSGRLTCVDISERWMNVLMRNLKGFNNVDFKLGQLHSLDIPEESFDMVVTHFVIHDIPDRQRQKVVRCLAEKLKPNGRFFIREPMNPGHGIPAEVVQALMGAAGLKELSLKKDKHPMAGLYMEGVYEKRA
ncbi:class I SAM-dependent methyltransferase [candidate division WOR-3 bacterium]|nr:class I SAM-dependent methyltransferase [candidate division WOR-3 bacterium]